jgi:hypothetical protein
MTKVSELVGRTPLRLPARSSNGGPPPSPRRPAPLLAIGAALLVGILIARFIDWRSHAHPHD